MKADTLFDAVVRENIPHANHESDLYLPDTPKVRALLAKYNHRGLPFTNEAEPHKGEQWLDVPFAFLPFWRERQRTL